MPKVAILTDSIACLTPKMLRQYQVKTIPINIHSDGRIYRDGVDLTTTEAYELLEQAQDHFASSPASAGECLNVFREAASYAEGILYITLSSEFSTVYNIANIAKEQAKDELTSTQIEIIDSKTAAGGEGLIVAAAAQAALEGKPLAEVIKIVETIRDRVNVIGIMETVRHVYRTGRIPRVTALVGSMLSIKPVFTISEGVVHVANLTRNKNQAIKRALSMMKEKIRANPVHVAVSHADAYKEGKRLKEQIAAEFNCVELWLSDFSPVMAYATGKGILAIAFYTD
jgi:DegV family protein with EDD domain